MKDIRSEEAINREASYLKINIFVCYFYINTHKKIRSFIFSLNFVSWFLASVSGVCKGTTSKKIGRFDL